MVGNKVPGMDLVLWTRLKSEHNDANLKNVSKGPISNKH